MIVSHGKFMIRADQLERAREIMSEMVEHTIKEPGCISYDYFTSLHSPNIMMLFQEWESIEAVNSHFATAHMDRFLKVLPELLEKEVVTHRYALHDDFESDIIDENQDSQSEIEFEFEEEPVTLH
jgi:quinol monooxygenase YgiN